MNPTTDQFLLTYTEVKLYLEHFHSAFHCDRNSGIHKTDPGAEGEGGGEHCATHAGCEQRKH